MLNNDKCVPLSAHDTQGVKPARISTEVYYSKKYGLQGYSMGVLKC